MKNHEEQILKSLKYHPEREPREEVKEQLKKELRIRAYGIQRKRNIINFSKITTASLASIFIVILIFSGTSRDFFSTGFNEFMQIFKKDPEQVEPPIDIENEPEQVEPNIEFEDKEKKHYEEITEDKLSVEDASKEGIQNLFDDLGIELFEWSPDGNKVIFGTIRFQDEIDFDDLYLWTVGENIPGKFEELTVSLTTAFSWAPDSEKVIVSLGTSAQREAIVVDVNTLEPIGSFVNFGLEVWSPDSNQIAFAALNNDVPDNRLTELSGSLNLAIYDLQYGVIQLLYGTEEYYYMPTAWSEPDKLSFAKYYFEGGQEEKNQLNPKIKDPKMSTIEDLPGLEVLVDQLYESIPQGLSKNEYFGYEHSIYQLYCYFLAIYYEFEDALEQTRTYVYNFETFNELAEAYKKNINFNTIQLSDVKYGVNDDQLIEFTFTYTNQLTDNHESFKINYDITDGSITDLITF